MNDLTVNYITPIMDRKPEDIEYARNNQSDLVNKNKGAWNYTDLNRICNNLKYAAERMYEKGFLKSPYAMQIKLNWKETDIITYEDLNNMIINVMNDLHTYSRPDLTWYQIASIANVDYNLANWIERDIHALATQEPLPPDTFKLTVKNGSGSGNYEARTKVTIQADVPEVGMVFDHWSGDHLENIENAEAATTTYTMPNEDITLQANYTGVTTHKLTINTYSGTEVLELAMGSIHTVIADPAPPPDKVFHHWEVNPTKYEDNLFEPSATTTFTMPNEDVSLTAIYIITGNKNLVVQDGNGTGWYKYDTYVSVSSNKPSNAVFTSWSGDTQYLTGPITQEYNSVKIPDKTPIKIKANWTIPPVTNITLKVINGIITSIGETEGVFNEGDRITIKANIATEGQTFFNWTQERWW